MKFEIEDSENNITAMFGVDFNDVALKFAEKQNKIWKGYLFSGPENILITNKKIIKKYKIFVKKVVYSANELKLNKGD